MKNNLFLLSALFVFLFVSCDKIKEDHFISPVPQWEEAEPEPDAVLFKSQKVLLEDITGHRCVNCPAASDLATQISTDHSPKVVLVAIHAGGFARPIKPNFTADFRTPEGNTIYDYYKPSGTPSGQINRVIEGATETFPPAQWKRLAEAELSKTPSVYMSLKNSSFDATSGLVRIKVTTTFPQGNTENLHLVVLVTEDSIVSRQAIEGLPDIEEYVHNHMLRQMPLGAWGQEYLSASKPVSKGYSKAIAYEFPLGGIESSIIPMNCHLVAYIMDSNTKRIWQVEEIALKDIVLTNDAK